MFGEERIPDRDREALTYKVFSQIADLLKEEQQPSRVETSRGLPIALTPEQALEDLRSIMSANAAQSRVVSQ